MSNELSAPIAPGVYRIISDHGLVLSLEKGIPRGNLVVEKPDESVRYQKWAVAYQSDGIYTFKSMVDEYRGKKIPDARQPYARNTDEDKFDKDLQETQDPYIRGGELVVFSTYRIRPHKGPGDYFTIGLPERPGPTVWTVLDDNTPGGTKNIIVDEYDTSKVQLWKFERLGNFK